LSKIYGESIGFVYGRKFNIPFTCGRYHNVYGPRMGYAHVIPEMFIKINEHNVIDVPSSTHTRAFCFIDDAIEFTIRACENPNTNNEILHIGNSSEEISVKDLVFKISSILGKSITLNELADTPGSPARRCPDITKIQSLTGYSPCVTLSEGIQNTYRWYKDKLVNRYE
jgi:nucleoside-diphosphate-sugar epimerase